MDWFAENPETAFGFIIALGAAWILERIHKELIMIRKLYIKTHGLDFDD